MSGAVLALLAFAQSASADCRLDKGPQSTVARVLDVETVELADGARVRLAGILGPRARDVGVAEGRWPPEIAAKAALEERVTAKAVHLHFDATRRDRHGNLLAHLIPADAAEGSSVQGPSVQAPSVQALLLAAGHARVDAIDGQRRCIDALIAAEEVARAAGLGLWAEPGYRIRRALPARDLAAYQGTFQVLTGTVAMVENGRGVIRLILGNDRRRDVAAILRSTDRDVAGALGGDVKRLTGRQVEIRGWLTQRAFGGPEIDLSRAGHVRLLEPAP